MNEQLTPGTPVDVTIRGAAVTSAGDRYLMIQLPWSEENRRTCIDTAHPSVTVTRLAPTPQAGQVWELADGTQMVVYADHGFPGHLVARDAIEDHGCYAVSDVDWSGATQKYPPTAGDQVTACGHTFIPGDSPSTFTGYVCTLTAGHTSVHHDQPLAYTWPTEDYEQLPPFTPGVQTEDTATGTLRRLLDADHATWIETAPGSGIYDVTHPDGRKSRCADLLGLTRDQIETCYGELDELEPVPAADTDRGDRA